MSFQTSRVTRSVKDIDQFLYEIEIFYTKISQHYDNIYKKILSCIYLLHVHLYANNLFFYASTCLKRAISIIWLWSTSSICNALHIHWQNKSTKSIHQNIHLKKKDLFAFFWKNKFYKYHFMYSPHHSKMLYHEEQRIINNTSELNTLSTAPEVLWLLLLFHYNFTCIYNTRL